MRVVNKWKCENFHLSSGINISGWPLIESLILKMFNAYYVTDCMINAESTNISAAIWNTEDNPEIFKIYYTQT